MLCLFWIWRTGLRLDSTREQLAQGYLAIGKLKDAALLASDAIDKARHQLARGREAGALYVLGEITLSGNPVDIAKAADHYRQAIVLADPIGLRPLVAHCHIGLGKLHRRTGALEQARRTDCRSVPELHQPSSLSRNTALTTNPFGSLGRGSSQKPLGNFPEPSLMRPCFSISTK